MSTREYSSNTRTVVDVSKVAIQSPGRVTAALLAVITAAFATALGSTDALGSELPEPGVMMRSGTWNGGVGTYSVPEGLANLKPPTWPNDQWHRLEVLSDKIVASKVDAPRKKRPKFLEEIATQVLMGEQEEASEAAPAAETDVPYENVLFARFAGAPLRTGEIPLYLFKNGTSTLSPKLGYRYELSLGDKRFAFTANNGFKAANGAPYGDGAQYTIEYDGSSYEYSLPEYGWDSRITAIADLDGDGKPDFLISVSGSNSGHEYLLLSTLARPGKNPPSASLHSTGC